MENEQKLHECINAEWNRSRLSESNDVVLCKEDEDGYLLLQLESLWNLTICYCSHCPFCGYKGKKTMKLDLINREAELELKSEINLNNARISNLNRKLEELKHHSCRSLKQICNHHEEHEIYIRQDDGTYITKCICGGKIYHTKDNISYCEEYPNGELKHIKTGIN